MRTHRFTAAIAALTLALVACDAAPTSPDMDDVDELGALFGAAGGSPGRGPVNAPGSSTANDRGTGGGGSVFDMLNARIDGFAGLYRAGMCSIVLMLTNAANVDDAVRTAQAAINPLVGRSCSHGVDVIPQRADWTWDEIHRLHSIAAPLAGSAGVYAVSLDIPRNAVVIVVDSGETARRVAGVLDGLGVLSGAVQFLVRGGGGVTR